MQSSNKRSKNFTIQETKYIIQLLDKYKYIIECKITNAAQNELKEKTRKKIAEEFNSLPGNHKPDSGKLRNYVKNLKTGKEGHCAEFMQQEEEPKSLLKIQSKKIHMNILSGYFEDK